MPLFKFEFLPRVEVSLHLYVLIIFTFCVTPILALFALEVSARRERATSPRGCRKLGLRVASNLADEFESRYHDALSDGQWRVKSLWIYPVKSCRGVELQRGTVVDTGMQYDRHLSFAQLKDDGKGNESWGFLSQRRYPLMARIETEMWVPDPSSPTYSTAAPAVQSGGVIVVSFPVDKISPQSFVSRLLTTITGKGPRKSFRVPFLPTPAQIKNNGYTLDPFTIWKDTPGALNLSSLVPPELQAFLGVTTRLGLFRVAPGREREVFRCAPRKADLGWQPITGFADAYPLHILNLASVRDLSAKQPADAPRLSARRFRPNIIVSGPPAYEEDRWKKINVGDETFFVACRTGRCRLPNTDPDTGEKHPSEPDRTLKAHRRVDPGSPLETCMGMQMVPASDSMAFSSLTIDADLVCRGWHC